MTTYLLVISFIVHFIVILTVLVLFQRKSVERANIPSMQEDVEAIHESIASFVDEMEKDNHELYEALVQHVDRKEHLLTDKWKDLESRVKHLEAGSKAPLEEPVQHVVPVEQPLSAKDAESVNDAESIKDDESVKGDDITKEAHPEQSEQPEEQIASSASVELDSNHTPFDRNLQKAEDLYKQGFNAAQIAKLLRIGNGEAQLIVHMLRRR